MKYFVNFLKGFAVVVYHAIPLCFYETALLFFYFTCATSGLTSFYHLIAALIFTFAGIVLTFTIGYKHFNFTFPHYCKKTAAANKEKKNF